MEFIKIFQFMSFSPLDAEKFNWKKHNGLRVDCGWCCFVIKVQLFVVGVFVGGWL